VDPRGGKWKEGPEKCLMRSVMIFEIHHMILGISCSGRQTVEACGASVRAGKIIYVVGLETREGKSQLGIRIFTWEDNIKMDLNKMVLETVNYILGTSGCLSRIRNEL
jgi:hypothetical protein